MLRSPKMLAIYFVLALIVGGSVAAYGVNFTTYEMGPIHVEGMGGTLAEAQAEAWVEVYETMIAINRTLPMNENIHDFYVVNEGMVAGSTYEVDFVVVVGVQPNMPMGL